MKNQKNETSVVSSHLSKLSLSELSQVAAAANRMFGRRGGGGTPPGGYSNTGGYREDELAYCKISGNVVTCPNGVTYKLNEAPSGNALL